MIVNIRNLFPKEVPLLGFHLFSNLNFQDSEKEKEELKICAQFALITPKKS